MKKLYLLLLLTSFITGCASLFNSNTNSLETRLISSANGQHDLLKQARALEKEGVIKGTEIVESVPMTIRVTGPESVLACLQEPAGRWVVGQNECEYMAKSHCEVLEGEYQECASACRNDPEAVVCIQMCVPVCKFSG